MAAARQSAQSSLRQVLRPWQQCLPVCQHHLCSRQASTSSFTRGGDGGASSHQSSDVEPLPPFPKPPSGAWYTGRPALNTFMDTLESTLKNARSTLYHKGYLTSVSQDVRTLPTSQAQLQRQSSGSRWLSAETLAGKIGAPKVRLAYYRQITGLLGELQALLPYLQQEGQGEIVEQLLKTYARPNNTAALTSLLTPEEAAEVEAQRADSRGGREHNRGYGYLSPESGVSYAIGRKKTATAQAYILPLPQTASNSKDEPALGQILVNSKPISQYFPSDADRSQILRPFALTECVGKYNVFILVSGSGMSSQTQAATVACARALAARDLSDDQAARKILSKADLLRRDPRVVERKKTGKPKARKSFTWVKR